MRNENGSGEAGGGVGFFGLLGIAFIVLKLTGVIDWPWLWVLAPLWGPLALAIVFLLLFFLGKGILHLTESDEQRKIRKAREALDEMARRYQ